jgi:hypothetical protein
LHIHSRQKYKNKVWYVSSFTRWSHGEPRPKGFIDFTYDLETLEYDVQFVDNKLAPEYVTVKISDIIDTEASVQDKVEAIKQYLEENSNVKVKLGTETGADEIAILKEVFSSEESVKIDLSDKLEVEKEETDHTYDFVLNREYDIPTTVMKFIKLTKNTDIELKNIEEILEGEEEE